MNTPEAVWLNPWLYIAQKPLTVVVTRYTAEISDPLTLHRVENPDAPGKPREDDLG